MSNSPSLSGGYCHIILGPMSSGKTTYLTHQLTRWADIGFSCLFISHCSDIRNTAASGNGVTTHNSQFKGLSHKVYSCHTKKLSEVDISQYEIVGIDEGHFFNDLYDTVRQWVLEDKKTIYIASLDGDSNMKPYGQALDLIPISSTVEKKNAICTFCLKKSRQPVPAIVTACRVTKSEQNLVGGLDIYVATCLKCYDTVSIISPLDKKINKKINKYDKNYK